MYSLQTVHLARLEYYPCKILSKLSTYVGFGYHQNQLGFVRTLIKGCALFSRIIQWIKLDMWVCTALDIKNTDPSTHQNSRFKQLQPPDYWGRIHICMVCSCIPCSKNEERWKTETTKNWGSKLVHHKKFTIKWAQVRFKSMQHTLRSISDSGMTAHVLWTWLTL